MAENQTSFLDELDVTEQTIKLTYDQKVVFIAPTCTCDSGCINPLASKVLVGKLKGYKDSKYIVEAIDDNQIKELTYRVVVDEGNYPSLATVCGSAPTIDTCLNKKKSLYNIDPKNIFVNNISYRKLPYSNEYGDFELNIGKIIKVYPFSDNFEILSFNSDFSKVLVKNISANGQMEAWKVLNLLEDVIMADTVTATIDYKYDVVNEE